MKKYMLIFGFCCSVMGATPAVAGSGNVRFTVHNLSNNDDRNKGLPHEQGPINRKFFSVNEDQVCVFCHTPHNAKPAVPLWNKFIPGDYNNAGYFKMYTSSRTLTPTARAATAPGAVSLLCLSCHDGKTAINVLHNSKAGSDAPSGGLEVYNLGDQLVDMGNYPGEVRIQDFSFGFKGATNIGGEPGGDVNAGNLLSDDHPIGFSYTAAQAQSNNRLNDLASVSTKSGGKIRFFAPNNSVECSSCHDPHVNYSAGPGAVAELRPFLAMSNTGSSMCLACHNK
ncbi:cytochrome C [Pelotalea chapellei]|uniref:Cytochrome C n=1 Tax=Pelotalea chapellei TaxID=44671 RepID=A0ABS5UA08_9BACT|nr:cytochrome C [Pelotalea chapellei]MBT1072493.1 cytochrome C [Pelotalea chapellei]